MKTEEIAQYLESDVGKDLQTLIAFTILKTPNQIDDKILEDTEAITEVVSQAILNIAELEPTEKEAKKAGVSILKKVAELTETKWDDRAISLLDLMI